jgi:hypothetical protein
MSGDAELGVKRTTEAACNEGLIMATVDGVDHFRLDFCEHYSSAESRQSVVHIQSVSVWHRALGCTNILTLPMIITRSIVSTTIR